MLTAALARSLRLQGNVSRNVVTAEQMKSTCKRGKTLRAKLFSLLSCSNASSHIFFSSSGRAMTSCFSSSSSVEQHFPTVCRIVRHCLAALEDLQSAVASRLHKTEKDVPFKVIQDNVEFNVEEENSRREFMEPQGQTTVT